MKKAVCITKNEAIVMDRDIFQFKAKLVIFAAICFIALCMLGGMKVKAATKKQIEEKVAKLDKEIAELEKKKKNAQDDDAKLKKGYTYIYGDLLCGNPCIVSCGILTGNGTYWVTDDSNMTKLIAYAGGYIKTTGNYRTYNGITCVECKSVAVSDKYSKQVTEYDKKISEKKKLRDSYSNALNAKVTLPYNNSGYYYVTKGDKFTPDYYVSENKYNKLKWSSSNKKVVKVSKKGVIKAAGYGTAEVTVKTSISGSELKFTIKVCKKVKKIVMDDTVYINYTEYKKQIYQIPCITNPDDANIFIGLPEEYDNFYGTKVATLDLDECEDNTIAIKILNPGETTMTITDYNNTLLKTVSIIVYNPLKKLEFTEKQYECAPYGEDCEYIELITKPDPCDEPIRFEYNKKLVEVEDCYDGTYKVLLLTDKPAEIKAISATGLEAVCEIIPYEDDDY